MIKHITLPLTEPMYIGASFGSLYLAYHARRIHHRGRWAWFAGAALLAVLAYQTRTIGLMLFPALGLAVFFHPSHASFTARLARNGKKLSGFLVLGLMALTAAGVLLSGTSWFQSQFVSPDSYFQSMLARFQAHSPAGFLRTNLSYRALEAGELSLNAPQNKFPAVTPLYYVAGILTWLAVLIGMVQLMAGKKARILFYYFLPYTGILLIWPYYDARFWLPVMPVMALAVWTFVSRLGKVVMAGRIYLGLYLAVGLVALGYSTRLTFSGEQFSERFGDGTLKMSYRYAQGSDLPVDTTALDPLAVRLLEAFDPASQEAAEAGRHPGE
jgi:hypothetical protein